MKRLQSTLLCLLTAACGGAAGPSTPSTPPKDPSLGYAPAPDRLSLDDRDALVATDFAALGAARAGANYVGPTFEAAQTRYVAPTGDDAADGTEDRPWRTLARAAEAAPGTRVLFAAGDYPGGLEITTGGEPGAYLVFEGQPGARLLGGHDNDAVVHIEASWVVVRGFEITGHQRPGRADTVGIEIEPRDADLTEVHILGNVLHGIGPGVIDEPSCYYNGHGIIARAEGHAITQLVIEGNELFDLYVGHSECLVVNGNVAGFRIAKNYIHETNNIAIDVIGYEVSSNETARQGLIADNVVLDASNYWPYCSRGNCAYPIGDESSGGIYVDGGADTIIEHNVVGRADHGIELQSENGELIRNVEVRFNVVFNSNYKNFTLGDNDGSSTEHDNAFFDDPRLADAQLEACKGG